MVEDVMTRVPDPRLVTPAAVVLLPPEIVHEFIVNVPEAEFAAAQEDPPAPPVRVLELIVTLPVLLLFTA